jgi:hypothetical protein
MKIQKCFYIVLALFIVTCGLLWYSYKQYQESSRLVDEIEYYDSLNTYNKVYYSKTFSSLRKENKQLYDSLKQYKDKIDYIVQFYHEKEYNTGNSTIKPNIKDSTVYDTIPMVIPSVARTYEYVSEPNDTFQYKLNVNSFTEPKWYSIQAKVKNKFTIVNKEDGDANHVTIKPDNGGTVSDVTVFHKKETKNFWDRFSIGPGFTAGYDPVNKQWGVVGGVTVSYKLN